MPFRVLIYDNSEVAFNKQPAVENTECKASELTQRKVAKNSARSA